MDQEEEAGSLDLLIHLIVRRPLLEEYLQGQLASPPIPEVFRMEGAGQEVYLSLLNQDDTLFLLGKFAALLHDCP